MVLDTTPQIWYIIMNETVRMVTLHKHETELDGVVWQIELDGVNTSVGLTQSYLECIRKQNIFEVATDGLAENLAINDYPITNKEKDNLNKLLQCMT